MTVLVGVLLIALPVSFNVFFAALAAVFEYPQILRRPTAEILAKFRAGGSRLVLLWWGFAITAVVFAPMAVLLSAELRGADAVLLSMTAVAGVLASLVQFLGLMRWPFVVPYLAREAEAASSARLEIIEILFQTLNRYLGVAIGEHLGYLFTGTWSILVGIAITQSSAAPGWIGIVGIVIGALLAMCSLEFVGPFERNGWKLAGDVTPIAYIAWSVWLVGLGVLLLI
jgi:hypothetical protein